MVKPWRYALGEFALGLPGTVVGAYMFFHYTDNLGLAIAYGAVARVVNAIWDGINDPIVGYLSDRTHTRWGRRRPWMLVGIPLYLILSVVAFVVPEGLKGAGLFAWFLALLLAWETSATVSWIAFHSLLPQLFPTEESRLHTNTWKKVNYMVAQIIGFGAAPLLVGKLSLATIGLLFAIPSALAAFGLLYGLKEPPAEPAPQDGPGFLASVLATLQYSTYRYYLVVHGFTHLTLSILMTAMPFYAKYSLRLDGAGTSALFATVFVSTIPGTALWARLARPLGTLRALTTALGCFAVSIGALAVVPNLISALVAGVFIGLGMAGFVVLGDVVIARIADRDRDLTGLRREGMFFSVIWVVARGANVLQAGAFALAGILFGYVSGEQPGEAPGTAFRFLMGVVPFIGLSLAFLSSIGLAIAFRKTEGDAARQELSPSAAK